MSATEEIEREGAIERSIYGQRRNVTRTITSDTGEESDDFQLHSPSQRTERDWQEPGAFVIPEAGEEFPRPSATTGNFFSRERDLPFRSGAMMDAQVSRTPPRLRYSRGGTRRPYIVTRDTPALSMQQYQLLQTPSRPLRPSGLHAAIQCADPLGTSTSFFPSEGSGIRTVTANVPVATTLALQVSPGPRRGIYGPVAGRAAGTLNSTSTASSKGRKKSWWVVKCFLETFDENMEKRYVCLACKTHRSGKLSASRLAEHLWMCERVDEGLRQRLYNDSAHIRSVVKRYSRKKEELNSDDEGDCFPVRKRRSGAKPSQLVDECSDSEADEISMLLVRAAIDFCLPLTIFDSSESQPNSFRKAFVRARSGLRDKYPSRHKVMVKYLPKLYNQTLTVVKRSLEQMLAMGFGTVIFDGWDDITMSSVFNILLRVESKSIRKTFFLDSVFTGHKRMGATEYVRIVEQVMQNFGGLERICGVASDSARACVNARKALADKYGGLIGIQDQAHVADLLMKDIGKLAFVKDVLNKVNMLVVETRSRRKLLSFVREEAKRANKAIHQEQEADGRQESASAGSTLPSDPLHPDRLFPPLRKTAVMLRKPATTRFASISDTLEAFIRTREVLGKVILHPQFERNLFTADKPEQELRREEYKALISNPQFLEAVRELHNVFRLCRRYLRVFDMETGTSVADVVGYTEFLDKALNKVPTSASFLTQERLEMIKTCFKKRKDGPIGGRGIQVRLIEDLHVAACLLHPTNFLADYQCYQHRFYAFVKRFVCSTILPRPQDEELEEEADEQLEEGRNSMIDKIMNDYDRIHSRWMLMSSQDHDDTTSTTHRGDSCLQHDEIAYRKSPFRFWIEESRVGSCPELCELALRTLSISPSSCAAERSFSVQGRVRTKLRNRLAPDVVRKMMFVRWNIQHYDESLHGASARDRDRAQSSSSRRECFDDIPAEEDDLPSTDGSESEGSNNQNDEDLL